MARLNILYLVFGWLLGICSYLIVDRIRRHYSKDEFKRGLTVELKEVRLRLAGAAYLIGSRIGVYDRDLLSWVEHISAQYDERKTLESIQKLLKHTVEEINTLAKQQAQKGVRVALGLKKYSLAFLEANMGSLSLLDSKLQLLIIQVRTRLNLLNEETELNRFYFEKTFDSTLGENNYNIITQNLNQGYRNILNQSRMAADQITHLLSELT